MWITTALGVGMAIFLGVQWESLEVLQRIVGIYCIALACHEWEELKFPGGFVELVTGMTGIEIKNLGIAKFGLFLLTIYATVVPMFLTSWVWPAMMTIVLGYIETVEHLLAARVNREKFYSPGMITAIILQLPVSIYGTYYIYHAGLVHGIYWLWAILALLVPLFGLQAAIVRSNGEKWTEFMKNAQKKLFAKKA